MNAQRVWRTALVLAAGTLPSCMDVTDIELLEIGATGAVVGQAFLDLNANGVTDTGDAPLKGVSVILTTPGLGAVVEETTTDSLGVFSLPTIPIGTYEVRLDSAALGDSLTTVGLLGTVTVQVGLITQRNLGASYPSLTLAGVRAAAPGRRVFTQGIALNARQSNGDGVVHLREGSVYLRTTNVQPINLAPGDSVRVLGRTAVDSGQPTLDQVTAVVLRQNAVFLTPTQVSLATADSAGGGSLDAALVRIDLAEIGDTTTVGGHLHFWAHNGVDSLAVVLRDFLLISPSPPIRPDTTVRVLRATGLLVPYVDASGPRWRLLPRSQSDIVTETKSVDVAITTSFDTLQASVGDTVEIRVTARNGPAPQATHTATGVSINDVIPTALTFLSFTATRGSYDAIAGVWSVGNLVPAAASDTLRISVLVGGPPGTVINAAQLASLLREVEANAANNSASAVLNIS